MPSLGARNTLSEHHFIDIGINNSFQEKRYPLVDRERCLGCGRCHVSCRDGGHQAITLRGRTPVIDGGRCVGCHLCSLVCPAGAIGKARRVGLPLSRTGEEG